MPWIRRLLRGNAVFVKSDAGGRPLTGSDGRVDVVYRAAPGGKVYRAAVKNLEGTGDPADDRPIDVDVAPGLASTTAEATAEVATAAESIIIYTDGACHGNPGPMGIGAVILDRGHRRELSEYLGQGTNNIAELTAILRALEAVAPAERGRPVLVHSDSAYALGLLGKGWKAKKNLELVEELRLLLAQFPRARLIKVAGHAGVSENERCDQLANDAVRRRR